MLKHQQHLFNLRPGIHYLNCAYKAPLLKSAEAAAIKALERERNPVDITPDDFFKEVDEVREQFGKLINCHSSEIAIIPSTSYGFSSVLNNITGKLGQHAITVGDEFPSGCFSLKKWCDNNKTELKIVKAGEVFGAIGKNWNDKIIESINEKTAVVLMSSIHWISGLKFDLENIGEKCKTVGAIFIVDGTQSVGALPLDVKKFNIDVLVCAGYKWLMGPYSLGLAYINHKFNNGIPLEEAWINRINAKNFGNLTDYEDEYTPNAGRYNVGEVSNFILMPMLNEALKQINKWTPAEIQSYCKNLVKPLITYLTDSGVQFESEKYFAYHLFSLRLPEIIELNALKRNLEDNNVYLSLRGNSLRVSIHVFNISEDIEKLIQVIEKTRKGSVKNKHQ